MRSRCSLSQLDTYTDLPTFVSPMILFLYIFFCAFFALQQSLRKVSFVFVEIVWKKVIDSEYTGSE